MTRQSPLSNRYVVAVTGGIASGKSAVTAEFVALGAAVFDADIAAREVVARGQAALAEIVSAFGANVLDAGGQLNRTAMRQLVFADPSARGRLEAIVHPRVDAWLRARAEAHDGTYCVLAIPLLAETWPAYAWVDRVLVVDVDKELQLSRLQQRDGIQPELALQMLRAQADRSQRRALADDVIDNSGTLAQLRVQVAALDLRYRDLAARKRLT